LDYFDSIAVMKWKFANGDALDVYTDDLCEHLDWSRTKIMAKESLKETYGRD